MAPIALRDDAVLVLEALRTNAHTFMYTHARKKARWKKRASRIGEARERTRLLLHHTAEAGELFIGELGCSRGHTGMVCGARILNAQTDGTHVHTCLQNKWTHTQTGTRARAYPGAAPS